MTVQEWVWNYPKSRTSSKKKKKTCCVYNLKFNSLTMVTDVVKNKTCRHFEWQMHTERRGTNVREPYAIWRKQQESTNLLTAAYLLTFSVLPRGLSVLPDHLWSCAKSNRAGLGALAFHCSSLHISGGRLAGWITSPVFSWRALLSI